MSDYEDDEDMAPFQRHSATSYEAALNVAPRAGTLRARVLDFLKDRGDNGATDEEMQRYLPMVDNTQRPRRVELCRAGFVFDSGETRKTLSGDRAVVWRART